MTRLLSIRGFVLFFLVCENWAKIPENGVNVLKNFQINGKKVCKNYFAADIRKKDCFCTVLEDRNKFFFRKPGKS